MQEIIKLDKKDKKLLYELDFDGRLPFSQLGKKIGLSKQGTEYKFNNLIKKGVIKSMYPVINMPKLGYLYCRISITLQKVNKEKREEIIRYLSNHEKVFWLFKVYGLYDFFIVIWAKSLTEFKDFIEDIGENIGDYIKLKKENIATDVIHFQNRYLTKSISYKEIHIKETQERFEIDSLDQEILKILCKDARISLIEISKKLKKSPKVIAYRIKNLEKKKIIEGYRPDIDYNKIGYIYYKIFINLNNASKKQKTLLKEYIKKNPLLIYIVEGIALHGDIDIEMMLESNQQLFDFIEDLRLKFPEIIGEYQTIVFAENLKTRYLPF